MVEHPRALYEQIADDLRAAVQDGRYEVGAVVEPEPQLAERFGVSRVKINRAVGRLRAEGLLEVRRGIGTVVTGAHEAVTVHLPPEVAARARRVCGEQPLAEWIRDLVTTAAADG